MKAGIDFIPQIHDLVYELLANVLANRVYKMKSILRKITRIDSVLSGRFLRNDTDPSPGGGIRTF